MTRKDFITDAGRWILLIVLLTLGGYLAGSNKVSLQQYCSNKSNCTGCGLNSVCNPTKTSKTESDEKK
jgi:hypothetical protein